MESIRGAELLTAVFGRWPSFHDAEVLRLTLDRAAGAEGFYGPTLTAEIYAFDMTSDIGADGTYVLRNQVVVTFRFLEVDQLRLEDFNQQNALWGVYITDVRERQLERVHYEVQLASSFGVGASFVCNDAEVVAVRPWHKAQIEAADA